MNCQTWITLSQMQVLLNVKLSCTFLKITVSQMIIKGRSPTMRHVSKTHRVALDWLLDRVHLDPRIQIKFVDIKNQLADSLTEGNFTSDEWNHLLRLFSIMTFAIFSCSHFLSRVEHHVKESSGKKDRIRACGGKIKAKQPPTLDSGTSYSLGNHRLGWNSDFTQTAIPLKATESANSTPHRAHLTRATLATILVCTWRKDLWIVVLASLKSHSISSMCHRTLLEPQLSL